MDYTIGDKNQPTEKVKMVRLVLWSIWLSSGLMVLLLLGAIFVTLLGEISYSSSNIQQNIDSIEPDSLPNLRSIKEKKEVDDDVKEIIKQIYNRKGYSNPTPTPEDDEVVTSKPRRKRPLKLIGKDFDPNKSYIVKHPNGTLTYVFPNNPSSDATSTTSTLSPEKEEKIETDNLIDRMSDTDHTQGTAEYPTDLINEVMNTHRLVFEGAFGDDLVIPAGDALNARSNAFGDEFLCDSAETLVHPRSGTTRNNSTVWIVNTEDYKQGVRIETCRYKGKQCNFCEVNAICKQVYHYRTLVAVDKISGKATKEQILLPSCCKCARVS